MQGKKANLRLDISEANFSSVNLKFVCWLVQDVICKEVDRFI